MHENESQFGPILSEQSAFWIGLGFTKLEEERFETVRFSADWLAGGLRTGGIAIAINVGLCACCLSESYPAGLFHGKQAASLYE